MSYEFYKVLHVIGLILTLSGLVGLIASYFVSPTELPKKNRLPWIVMHGLGLVIILVSGFGLAARLNYFGNLPGWVHTKIAIWLVVGLLVIGIRKVRNQSLIWLALTVVLFSTAAFFAVNKVGA